MRRIRVLAATCFLALSLIGLALADEGGPTSVYLPLIVQPGTPTAAPDSLPVSPIAPTVTGTAARTATPPDSATVTPTSTPTSTATATPTAMPSATNTATATATPVEADPDCHPSYPDICIPPPPPDLNCDDIPYRRFRVLPPDPHRFDGDKDGIGCES